VASVLGHEDANTTLRYAHLFDRERTDRAVRDALGGEVAQ
jgi:integrase